jgi:tRNA-modifying protein YgfZ
MIERKLPNTESPGPVYIEQPQRGVIVFSGKDRIDFLQRQTTNDLRQIGTDRILTTVLTSPTGRILDLLQVIEEEVEGVIRVLAITLPGRSASTVAYFKSRIFFMDQVEVSDVSHNYAHFDLAGQGIEQILLRLGFPIVPEGDQLASTHFQASKLKAFPQNPRLGIGYQLLAPQEHREKIISNLERLGARQLTIEEYGVLRVEAGIPAVDLELSEEHTPLEVNLENAISVHKGCYTGQEVIARQMNYDKITRKLVGLSLERKTAIGSQLQVAGKPVGKVTSFAHSPRYGPIALGIVKRPHHQDGTELTVKDGEMESVARVISLPFDRRE